MRRTGTPPFHATAKSPAWDDNGGIVVYFTPQCPYYEYYVNVAEAEVVGRHGLPCSARPIRSRDEAQDARTAFLPHPVFYHGELVTQEFSYGDRVFDRVVGAALKD